MYMLVQCTMYLVYPAAPSMRSLLAILSSLHSSTEKHFNEDSLLIIDDFRTELINYDEGGDGRC